jgi:hypothetical protein
LEGLQKNEKEEDISYIEGRVWRFEEPDTYRVREGAAIERIEPIANDLHMARKRDRTRSGCDK